MGTSGTHGLGSPVFFYLPKWWLCIKGDYPQTGLVQVCVLFKACPDPFKQSLSTHVNSGHKFKWHSFLEGYFAMIHHVWFFFSRTWVMRKEQPKATKKSRIRLIRSCKIPIFKGSIFLWETSMISMFFQWSFHVFPKFRRHVRTSPRVVAGAEVEVLGDRFLDILDTFLPFLYATWIKIGRRAMAICGWTTSLKS